MCFSSPKPPPTPKEPPKAPSAKPQEAKSKEQRQAEQSAVESTQYLAKQKNRNHFRIQLGSGMNIGKKGGGSGLSL